MFYVFALGSHAIAHLQVGQIKNWIYIQFSVQQKNNLAAQLGFVRRLG